MSARAIGGGIAAVLLSVVVVGGLLAVLRQPGSPLSGLPPGAVRIPTRDFVDGNVLCTLGAAIPPLRGFLRGDVRDADWPVWLELLDRQRAYVKWPFGWSARFEPEVALLDATGRVVAGEGRDIKLGQVSLSSAAGTKSDPYLARGLFLDGCYP